MSDNFLANLPRFDRGDHDYSVSLGSGPDVAEAEDLAAPDGVDEDAVQQKLHAVEQTLAALADVTEQVQRETLQHAEAQLRSLAEKLFPALGHRFLADEIAEHLPDLLPPAVPNVEIRAEPDLAESLRAIVDGSNRLAGRCSVIDDEAAGANRAIVSWQEGGIDFDFAGLLEACLGRLKAA